MANQVPPMELDLGDYQSAVDARLGSWRSVQLARRIWDHDHTVWSSQSLPELTNRLGWLDLPNTMAPRVPEFQALAAAVLNEGYSQLVLLGMGGSSLAPEVFASVLGVAEPHPPLTVLDTTHPAVVRNVADQIDPARTLFLVASKSGSTLETMSLFRAMWHRVSDVLRDPGRNFVAITDAGSSLQVLAEQREFRQVVNSPSEVGGRYSALSPFGLVPAAIIGADVERLLARSRAMAAASAPAVPEDENPALVLGAVLGELALAGVDKITFATSQSLAVFPAWIEQLVAESTGKNGKGVLPVDAEPAFPPDRYGKDRLFVSIELAGDPVPDNAIDLDAIAAAGHPVVRIVLAEKADLAQEMFRWELATAAAGAILEINPFDQPDVQLAKELAKRAMADSAAASEAGVDGSIGISESVKLERQLQQWLLLQPGEYVAIQAYLATTATTVAALRQIREMVGRATGAATTLGFGPRFLHSTGQLHKGGPNTGRFLQLIDETRNDVTVPETDYSFGSLVAAQALGDYRALLQRDRRVVRVNLGLDSTAGMHRLLDLIAGCCESIEL